MSSLIIQSHVMSPLIIQCHIMSQVTSPLIFQSLAMSSLIFQSHVMSPLIIQCHIMSQVTSPLIFQSLAMSRWSSRVTSCLRWSSRVTSWVSSCLRWSSRVSSPLSGSSRVSSRLRWPSRVSSHLSWSARVLPRLVWPSRTSSRHVYYPEPRPVAVVVLQPSTVLSRETVSKHQRLASSVEDPPLVSARTAGIPKPTHFNSPVPALIPLPEALPMMGIALLRLGCVHQKTAWVGGIHCDVSRGGGAQQQFLSATLWNCCRTSRGGGICCRNLQRCQWCSITNSQCVPSRLRSPSVNSRPVLSRPRRPSVNSRPVLSQLRRPSVSYHPCLVTAMEAVCELSPCLVMAKEAVCESSSCPVTAMEAVCELSSCPVTAKEAVCESSFCPVTAMEAICELLPCSEPAMEASYEPLSCPDPAMGAGYELSSCPAPAMGAIMNFCFVLNQLKKLLCVSQLYRSQPRRLLVNTLSCQFQSPTLNMDYLLVLCSQICLLHHPSRHSLSMSLVISCHPCSVSPSVNCWTVSLFSFCQEVRSCVICRCVRYQILCLPCFSQEVCWIICLSSFPLISLRVNCQPVEFQSMVLILNSLFVLM